MPEKLATQYTEEGTAFLQEGQFEKAMQSYFKAAELGDFLAMYNIACMYYFGDGVKKDDTQAYMWYCKAAEAGDPEAANRAGLMKEQGIGTDVDLIEAAKDYAFAAEHGSLSGMMNYALCKLEGKGLERDTASGLEWLEKASIGGNGIASVYLGDCYLEGTYVSKDLEKAKECYMRGKEQKYAPAIRKLASLCSPKEAESMIALAERLEAGNEEE